MKKMATLQEIQNKVHLRLGERQKKTPFSTLIQGVTPRTPVALDKIFPPKKINVIAEIKRASPSQGDIAPHVNPAEIAKQYCDAGACALSVLTESDYFKGDLEFLAEIRKYQPSAVLLMKDFLLEEYQIVEGLKAGADLVLLILAMLNDKTARLLFEKADYWGLVPLVEVHNEVEMKRALELGAKLIGVNNRDLKTMSIDLKTSENLASYSSKTQVLISESGLKSAQQLTHLSQMGYKGFLMGTELMKTPSPGNTLMEILKVAHAAKS